MVAEHKIDRQKLISGHNPVLTEIATDCRRYTRNIRNSRCVQCHNGDGTRNR